jgi:hypothetical protein
MERTIIAHECQLCQENKKQFKVSNCGHSFCTDCIKNMKDCFTCGKKVYRKQYNHYLNDIIKSIEEMQIKRHIDDNKVFIASSIKDENNIENENMKKDIIAILKKRIEKKND